MDILPILLLSHLCVLLLTLVNEFGATSNLASYQPATQVGTFNGQSASLAVDNDPTGTCCFSDSGTNNSPAWWQVDLQHQCYITSVSIQFPNSDDCQYADGFVIIVSDNNLTNSTAPLCYTFTNGSNTGSGDTVTLRGLHPTYTCDQPLTGRYVTIRRQGGYQPKSMSLCNVQVNGIIMVDSVDRAHTQPATHSEATYGGQVAGYAVDGDPTTCSFSDMWLNGNVVPWWQVDLQDQYTVNYVTALPPFEDVYAQCLNGFVVQVSNSNKTDSFLPSELCISYNVSSVPAGALLNLTCTQPVVGRYVTIKRNGGSCTSAISLCEVQIIGQYTAPTLTSIFPTTTTMRTTSASSWNPTSVNISSMNSATQCSCRSTVNYTAIIVGVVLGAILVAALIVIIFLMLKIRNMKNNSAGMGRRNDVKATDKNNQVMQLLTRQVGWRKLHNPRRI